MLNLTFLLETMAPTVATEQPDHQQPGQSFSPKIFGMKSTFGSISGLFNVD